MKVNQWPTRTISEGHRSVDARLESSTGTARAGLLVLALLVVGLLNPAHAFDPARAANTVVLDETAVKNLRLELVEAEETTFEETVFSLGRIEAIPSRRAVISSRIPGRILEIKAALGEMVEAGAAVVRIESRQPGDPPPSIVLPAPIGGLVTESEVRQGEPVQPDKALLEITDLREVYAIARVPEHVAGLLKPGAVAHIRLAALPEEKLEGELIRFGTAADRGSGTLDAVFRLPNGSLLLRPGMRAEFSIVLAQRAHVVSIPRAALQGEAANRFVYVEDFDLKYAYVKTPVQLGVLNDRFVEITNGLLPGDKVVSRGAYALAFAGRGSVSLKEALDAAHGHEHAEDGSELTPAQREARAAGRASGGTAAVSGAGSTKLTLFFAATTVLMTLLLLISLLRRRAMAEPPAA